MNRKCVECGGKAKKKVIIDTDKMITILYYCTEHVDISNGELVFRVNMLPPFQDQILDATLANAQQQRIEAAEKVAGRNAELIADSLDDVLQWRTIADEATERIEALEAALRTTDSEMVQLAREVDKSERLFIHDAAHIHDENAALLSPRRLSEMQDDAKAKLLMDAVMAARQAVAMANESLFVVEQLVAEIQPTHLKAPEETK